MKNFVFLIILMFLTGTMFSCNNGSSSSSDIGYVDPGNWTTGITLKSKAYNMNSVGSCGSSTACLAVIYQGTLSGTAYVGVAVRNGTNTLKIYWPSSTIQSGTYVCTVVLNATTYTNETLTINIAAPVDGTYSITFTGDSSPAGIVKSTDTITALKV